MKPLARRAAASIVCAAMLMAQWPASAWAAAGTPEPNPAEAMKALRSLGVFKDDADPLKSYLQGPDGKLTPIGRTLFLSLQARYNPAEEVESMKPIFERLRSNGTYTEARQDGAARAMKIFTQKFGDMASAPSGSVEEAFRDGAMREALMTGAAIPDPPKGNAYAQIATPDGYEFWDKNGLAFRMTAKQVTTYNRELQKTQRAMNMGRPPQAAPIPETGRYNYEMLQYSFWRLKNQENDYIRATRIDSMIAMAELLGKQYPTDMWFNEEGLEADLIRQAKAKTYTHQGETYSIYDIVEGRLVDGKRVGGKMAQRRAYIEGSRLAVLRFETDMNRFKKADTISDAQFATFTLDEQNALRWLSLTVLETQVFHVKNQRERVDPTSPDAQALMKMIDESDLTHDQKVAFKEQGLRIVTRLDELRQILSRTRDALNRSDYAGSLDSVQAALAATQKELGDLSVDYAIYLETLSTAFLAKSQATHKAAGYNPFKHLNNGVSAVLRGAYKMTPWGTKYEEDMKAIDGDGKNPAMAKTFTEIAALIAGGRREDWVEARRRIIAMNPKSAEYSMSGTAGGDPSKVNDALRISSSLRANHDRLSSVAETNKTLDATSSFVTWTISIALLAPLARASLNGVGKLSGFGGEMIASELKGLSGVMVRGGGYVVRAAGEIAKHSAARLESLEPNIANVKSVAGENAFAQYLVSSGYRAMSVAHRQIVFTGLSGGISAGFTAGTHLWDMGAKRIGGVNIAGWQAIEPGHTMFSEDLSGLGKAAVAGFKGGAWWANDSLDFGWFRIPTAALGYVGLPSTVFDGTRAAKYMEIVGSRGVVGSATTMIRGPAALEAAAASGKMGLLESLGEAKMITGKPLLAFGLSMADNVAKYALFSQGASWVGKQYAWYVQTNVPLTVPFVGVINTPEQDLERRIKHTNHIGNAWLESPLWMAIPTHAAHGARDAGPYMQTKEGMRQYDMVSKEYPNGRTNEYANAPVDKKLPLERVKPPLSQRFFEARYGADPPTAEWIVTKQVKEMGQLKEVQRLANEGGVVNPIELMAVREMEAGQSTFRTLNVTEEVQKFAYEVATEGLVAQPKNSMLALKIEPGRSVPGWGKITPEIQIEIAKALYRAEVNLGEKISPELHTKVREVLKDHLLANLPIGEAGKALRAAVVDLPLDSPKLDAAQKAAIDKVLAWEGNAIRVEELRAKQAAFEKSPDTASALTAKETEALALGEKSYVELTASLRQTAEAQLKAGELSPKEAKALSALYDYIDTGHERFNSFNRPEIVRSQADIIFGAIRIEYAERPEMLALIEKYSNEVHTWAESRRGMVAELPGASEHNLSVLIGRLQRELKATAQAAPGKYAPSEITALNKSLQDVNTSAWVVRDAKGSAIPSWRAKQYVRLMQAFLGEGGHPTFVRESTESIFEGVRKEHAGRAKMLGVVDGIEIDVNAWIKSREAASKTATPKELAKLEEAGMGALIDKIDARLKSAPGDLTVKETAVLSDLVSNIGGLDRQGLHYGILNSGRQGKTVQLFVKAPTSLGKTLLAYEGLLPYLEAEAAVSKRKVMFLTFNTKLQAQAEFDFLAFNKLGSEVKFETYEGLKTMIAEGKTKGQNIVEKYLLLQDEMDAAGQQPALTIGMVSGRVTRLNGQTTALNESNAGVSWAVERLDTIRAEAADVQAQRIKSVVSGLSEAHVEKGKLGAIRTAANDVLEAVGDLKRAKGPAETALAEKAIETGMSNLRRLSAGLPASEAEAANTIKAGLGRMTEALAERPSENAARRLGIAEEMVDAFASQSRLMDLVNTDKGLTRLPLEARKARMALEAKIERIGKNLAEAEASGTKEGGRRASLLREQLEFARLEKSKVEYLDGMDASSRLISRDEQIAAIRSGQTPSERLMVNPKLAKLMRESVELEAKGTPEAQAKRAVVDGRLDQLLKSMGPSDASAVKAYRLKTIEALSIDREIAKARTEIETAKKAKEPTDALESRLSTLSASREASKGELRVLETGMGAVKSTPKLDALVRESEALDAGMTPERRAAHQEYRALLEQNNALSTKIGEADAAGRPALEAERSTVRSRLRSIELDLSANPAKGDLGGTLRRIQLLSNEAGRIEKQLIASGDTGGLKAQLKQIRGEEKALRREARTEVMKRFDEAGADIIALTREGKPGWDSKVSRLLEQRRALQEAFAGDESAMYGAYRNMKESVRPIAENPTLTEKPYEIPGGEGQEPAQVLKRADFLIERARTIETKAKGGSAGPIELALIKARAETEALSAASGSKEFFAARDHLRKLEIDVLRADSFHTADILLGQIDGARIAPVTSLKLLWQVFTGTLPDAPAEGMGLTRFHAAKMLEALFQDPMMPAHQRDNLMWSYLGSLLLPKGVTGRGSYVRSELINMVQGFHDSAAGVRVDNKTGKFNVVHNGQWFESMDNASRRWWELEYGTDLTLPYTHNSMSTIKDVTTNKKSYFISLSGTAGNKFEAHLRANKISVVGEGSSMPKNVLLEVVNTPEQRMARVTRTLETLLKATEDQAVLRKSDIIPADAKAGIQEYMTARGLKPGDPHVFQISQVPGEAAQNFLHGIRATQKNTGLIVLSVSNTRELRKVEKQLKRAGLEQSEIAKVFADTEYLRQNVPEANVLRQMNIDGLTTGKVKVLILDTRVGGRGLDLNFKGERNSMAPDAFRGYTNFEMLVLGPEEMSAVHMVQAMGRIDTGRTLSQAPRQFSLLMDIETAKVEAVFRDMFEGKSVDVFPERSFFLEMRKDPVFQEFTRTHGGRIDWVTFNDYIQARAADGTEAGEQLAQRAEKAVRESLSRRNLEVEENLLIQSQVVTSKPVTESKNPALDRIR